MNYTRKQKEAGNADLFFASLINRFHQAMFGVDHDDPRTPNVNVFEIFNRAWVTFADAHNSKAKKIGVDRDAFYNYAIKRD
jgi:hypothetical protein